jgi:hypothetical protein
MYPNWDFWFENKPSGNPANKISLAKNGRFADTVRNSGENWKLRTVDGALPQRLVFSNTSLPVGVN